MHQLTAQIGDTIRSYDFPNRPDCFVEGVVINKTNEEYQIKVQKDVWRFKEIVPGRLNMTVHTPLITPDDYPQRIVKIA